MIRNNHVAKALELKRQAERVAITEAHPAVVAFDEMTSGLTDAEFQLVGTLNLPGDKPL